jgi:hypothetical protein
VRKRERERGGVRKRERERGSEKEGEREGVRKRERDVEFGCFTFILNGMTGALAPFSYLV